MHDKEKSDNHQSKIDPLKKAAYLEFSDASDFIWKCPRLLKQEYKIEIRKLSTYFPDNPKLASLRWHFEGKKLRQLFPYLMATGNLFSATSLFETYLLLLAKQVEQLANVELKNTKGQGLQRIFNFLKGCGIQYNVIQLWPQVDAAIKIRNCLTHANGLLEWSRDREELCRIIKRGIFLSKDHRKKCINKNGVYEELILVNSDMGERIQPTNMYSWLANAYYRDYFMDLCNNTKEVIKGKT